ncbi:NADPH:quinone reductase [Oceanicola sp. 22II-s10i]|uniref:3-keto-5-aminohexanoate cleavage protein n=1 Tax=Oceanicola sp. 22II-s10i TaxID=1317116 RepID=UPI000B525B08|nr:3-keto-5-aminohexanoate cleavage protein [Oceanicola sp. 22II-s10i]OWU81702.1 NADPH:quinone reductase [Oceanicola sp. 22II-s10i]
MAKTILTVAVTGNQTTLNQHPELPCTPAQIAKASIDAARAGAAVAHIHVRYDDGRPSMELEHYREVVERIRDSGCGLIINLTTGPGGRFVPSREDPRVAGPGTSITVPERRVEHVAALRPEICTLDLNTMWSGTAAVLNPPDNVKVMAQVMREAGSKPELEVFDSGDIELAKALINQGVLDRPPLFQIVTGIQYGFACTAGTIAYAKSMLPEDATWAGFGVGRMMYPMMAQAFLLGGHVRVGLEDGVRIDRENLAPDNAALVTKAKRIIEDLGGELATPDEARAILGLAPATVETAV